MTSGGGTRDVIRSAVASRAYPDAVCGGGEKLLVEEFAQPVRNYVYQCLDRPVHVLQAGTVTSLSELGLDKLRGAGFAINVVAVDQDHPRPSKASGNDSVSRTASAHRNGGAGRNGGASGNDADVTIGDLRTIPLPPRSFDIVHCSLLLDRINHVSLVLDRLGAALRPGGLMLLRIRERDCAAGFLDRRLPRSVRRAIWRRLYSGQPGPFAAIYERTASGRGIASFLPLRGLVIAHRKTVRTLPAEPARLSRAVSAAQRVIAVFSRGRLTDAHDQVLFVVRKPEDRFARVVLVCQPPAGRHVVKLCSEDYRP